MYVVINLIAKQERITFLYNISFTTKKVLFLSNLSVVDKIYPVFFSRLLLYKRMAQDYIYIFLCHITTNHMFYMLSEYFNKLVGGGVILS